MTECLPAAGQPSRGPGDTPIVIPKRKVSPEEYAEIAQLAAPPIVYRPVHVHDIPLANEVNASRKVVTVICHECGQAFEALRCPHCETNTPRPEFLPLVGTGEP